VRRLEALSQLLFHAVVDDAFERWSNAFGAERKFGRVLVEDRRGRHVADRAEHLACIRMRDGGTVGSVSQRLRPAELGQAEIQNFHLTIARDENVFGFEVAMDDALLRNYSKKSAS